MKIVAYYYVFAFTTTGFAAGDFLDRVEDALKITAFDDNARAQISGLVDLEFYRVDQPPPGLIDTGHDFLFNPRLSVFLDAQLGRHVYFYAQSRVDRDFDPSHQGARIGLDEYALRVSPWDDGRLDIQIGKFATVVGNFVKRHLSWENPFVTAPLPYENLTPVSDRTAPASFHEFVSGFIPTEDKNVSFIWGPNYASGASVSGRIEKFEYAAEIKNSSLASRPRSWDATQIGFEHPVFNGRIGFQPTESWNVGFSASNGPYLRPEAAPTLPPGHGFGDYRELLLGQDISFALHHLQLWAEFYEVRFEVPRVGNADTFAYYLEGKYKFTPQLFAALRWNQQLFSTVSDDGNSAQWGRDIWRIDSAIGYRFTPHTQLKLQYSLQEEKADSDRFGHTLAAQFTVRF